MLNWIEINREWFLSGVGVFAVSIFLAVVSSLLTLYIKFRSERKSRREISIQTKLNVYEIEKSLNHEHLAVSYKGVTYKNLCQYIILVNNSGPVAVDMLSILVTLPKSCKKIDFSASKSSDSLLVSKEQFSSENKTEELHNIKRIEPSDAITFSYILDTEFREKIDIQPRGVDGVRYHMKGYESIPKLRQLISYAAIFLFIGAIPFVGTMLQVLVLLAASNTIINVVEEFRNKNLNTKIEIGNIEMGNDSMLTVTNTNDSTLTITHDT